MPTIAESPPVTYSKPLAALGSTQPVPVVVTTRRCCRSKPPARSRSATASAACCSVSSALASPAKTRIGSIDGRSVSSPISSALGPVPTKVRPSTPMPSQSTSDSVAARAQRRRRSFDPLRRLEVAEGERRVERAQPGVSRHPAEQCPRHEAHRHDSQDPCHRGPEATLQQPSHPSRGGPGATRQAEEQRGDDQRHRWHEEHERDGRRLRPGQVVGLGLPPHARGEAREQGRDPSHQEDRSSQVRPRLPWSVAQSTPAPREEDPDAVPRGCGGAADHALGQRGTGQQRRGQREAGEADRERQPGREQAGATDQLHRSLEPPGHRTPLSDVSSRPGRGRWGRSCSARHLGPGRARRRRSG